MAAGEKFGIVPRIDDALDFARQSRVLLLRHGPTDTPLDVAMGGLPFELEAIQRSVTHRLGRATVKVASPEDLMIMKCVACRARDWADVENLLTAFPDADLERVRRWAGEFAEALEMPEITIELERLIARVESRHGP